MIKHHPHYIFHNNYSQQIYNGILTALSTSKTRLFVFLFVFFVVVVVVVFLLLFFFFFGGGGVKEFSAGFQVAPLHIIFKEIR